MFEGMGVQWASTLVGCVALLLVPIPVIFLKYGAKIRMRSNFAPTPPPFAGGGSTMDEEQSTEEKVGGKGIGEV